MYKDYLSTDKKSPYALPKRIVRRVFFTGTRTPAKKFWDSFEMRNEHWNTLPHQRKILSYTFAIASTAYAKNMSLDDIRVLCLRWYSRIYCKRTNSKENTLAYIERLNTVVLDALATSDKANLYRQQYAAKEREWSRQTTAKHRSKNREQINKRRREQYAARKEQIK